MGEGSKNDTPSGEDLTSGATGRYNLPGEGSEGELLLKKIKEASVRTYEVGEYLFHAGQAAECFWLIKAGRVVQYKGDARLNELGPRRFLGMRTFLLGGKFETTAEIVEPSEIVELDLVFLKNFLSRPEAVLAFLKEQERELFRIAEDGKRREVLFSAMRQQIALLEEQAKRSSAAGSASAGAELLLRLIRPDIERASTALDVLAREEPVLWRSLEGNETFMRLFLAVKNAAGRLGAADLSSHSERR